MTEKRLKAYDPITFESFTRHATKHREPYDQYDMGYTDAFDNIEDWLEANTVEAVEVVRCKDCVWCHKIEDLNYCENPNTPWIDDPDFDDITVTDNDYCSYGERKDNENP